MLFKKRKVDRLATGTESILLKRYSDGKKKTQVQIYGILEVELEYLKRTNSRYRFKGFSKPLHTAQMGAFYINFILKKDDGKKHIKPPLMLCKFGDRFYKTSDKKKEVFEKVEKPSYILEKTNQHWIKADNQRHPLPLKTGTSVFFLRHKQTTQL
jgi:hypothetical protein